jgi:hypothetical protein
MSAVDTVILSVVLKSHLDRSVRKSLLDIIKQDTIWNTIKCYTDDIPHIC